MRIPPPIAARASATRDAAFSPEAEASQGTTAAETSRPGGWSRLEFEGSKLGVSLRGRVERRRLEAGAAESELEAIGFAASRLGSSFPIERLEVTISVLGRHLRKTVLFSRGVCEGEERTVCFYADGESYPARVEGGGLRPTSVSFDVVDERGSRRIEGPRTQRRLIVVPEVGETGGSKLAHLGLRGALEVFVDRELAVPVLLRGRVAVAGEVEVRLARMERR